MGFAGFYLAGACGCLLWIVGAQMMACSKGDPVADKDPEAVAAGRASSLQVILKTDKESYRQGDEIHWEVVYVNNGDVPVRILVDDEFSGSNMRCSTEKGDPVGYEAGYKSWSPKTGVFTGKPHLIDPGGTLTVRIDSLVDFQYDLVFRNPSQGPGSADDQALKKQIGLPEDYPDKYLAAGRRFRMGQPGIYHFRWVYEAGENDKQWRFAGARTPEEASVEHLWLGTAESGGLRLEFR